MKTTIVLALGVLAAATLTTAEPLAAAPAQDAAAGPAAAPAPAEAGERLTLLPPAPTSVRDTVDVLYRDARAAMSAGRHEAAAGLFRRLAAEHPDSEYAADARYWEAFNLYRLDEADALRRALAALGEQARLHPGASTRRNGEAAALETRIRGRLAGRGDEAAARAVREAAEAPACDEETLEMRSAALNALVQIGPDDALPIFRDLLARRGDACVRELQMRVPYLLGRLESEEASDVLLELARSAEDPELRGRAVTHLGRTDDPRAADYLAELARRGPEGLRGKAMFALVTSEDERGLTVLREIAADASAPLDLRKSAVGYIGRSDAEVLPFFQRLFREAPELGSSLVYAASREEDPRAMEWLLEIALDASLEVEVRKSALYHAGRREDGLDAYLALWDRLGTPELKRSFIYGLSEREDPRALDFLIRTARTEPDPDLRKSAIYWLGRSEDPRAIEVLKEIIGGGV